MNRSEAFSNEKRVSTPDRLYLRRLIRWEPYQARPPVKIVLYLLQYRTWLTTAGSISSSFGILRSLGLCGTRREEPIGVQLPGIAEGIIMTCNE
jgi:hypothetical protein